MQIVTHHGMYENQLVECLITHSSRALATISLSRASSRIAPSKAYEQAVPSADFATMKSATIKIAKIAENFMADFLLQGLQKRSGQNVSQVGQKNATEAHLKTATMAGALECSCWQ